MSEAVTGSLIQSFYICKREAWLSSRELNVEREALLALGKVIDEEAYSRERKEIKIGNLKIDLVKRSNKKVVVGEIKKSSRFEKAAKMQLAFYLYRLEQLGINAQGELLIPREKKRIVVSLDGKTKAELDRAIAEIENIISSDIPPEPVKIQFCTKCAYREFCWA
jgi:CRISPR-associated exonuclease Cas4